MSSATLTPFKNATEQVTFSLQSESSDGANYIASGRSLSTPYGIQIQRKVATGTRNDHIVLRVYRTENNATTGKAATVQALLDISIPKDQSVINATAQKELLTIVMSLLRDATLSAATFTNVTALIEGRNL